MMLNNVIQDKDATNVHKIRHLIKTSYISATLLQIAAVQFRFFTIYLLILPVIYILKSNVGIRLALRLLLILFNFSVMGKYFEQRKIY